MTAFLISTIQKSWRPYCNFLFSNWWYSYEFIFKVLILLCYLNPCFNWPFWILICQFWPPFCILSNKRWNLSDYFSELNITIVSGFKQFLLWFGMSERFNLITGTYTFIFICLSVGNVALRFNFDTLLVIPLSCIAFYLYWFSK